LAADSDSGLSLIGQLFSFFFAFVLLPLWLPSSFREYESFLSAYAFSRTAAAAPAPRGRCVGLAGFSGDCSTIFLYEPLTIPWFSLNPAPGLPGSRDVTFLEFPVLGRRCRRGIYTLLQFSSPGFVFPFDLTICIAPELWVVFFFVGCSYFIFRWEVRRLSRSYRGRCDMRIVFGGSGGSLL